MKTVHSSKFIVHSFGLWRMVALLFMVTLFSEAKAQDENAAFYIYQNDGHFDGFFYDEVQKISYSKLDTLGIEHEDYVSQEIVTADSTYRVMLAAIDSVSFVQPEIRYNPKLRDMRKEGMLAYLTSKDEENFTLTFSSSMPESLRPRVGDVVVDFDIDEAFGGKVKSVSPSGTITVACEPLESVHDIFEQFVTIEQYGKDRAGNLVRRRVAGMPQMNIGKFPSKASKKAEGEYEFNIFNFSLSGHYPVYTSPKGDVNISVDADVNVATDVKATWNFPWRGKDYLGILLTLNNDIGFGVTLDGKIKDIFPMGLDAFGGLPLPAAAPIFVIEFGPDGFLRGEYHAKINFATPKYKGKLWAKLEYDGDWSDPTLNFGRGTPPGEEEPDPVKEAEDNNWSGSIEFNGYEQVGIKTSFSFGLSKLLSMLAKTKVELTTYVGPKISGALNFSLSNVMQDEMSAYNLLKDSKLSFTPVSADYEAKATMKTLFTDEREWTLLDGSYNLLGDIDLFLVPNFEVEAVSEKPYEVTAKITPSGNIIWPLKVGMGLFYDNTAVGYYEFDGKNSEGMQMPSYSQFSNEWNESKSASYHKNVGTGGEYEVRPLLRLGDFVFPASPAKKVEIQGLYLRMQPYEITFSNTYGEQKTITLNTNATDIKPRYSSRDYNCSVSGKQLTISPKIVNYNFFANYTDNAVTGFIVSNGKEGDEADEREIGDDEPGHKLKVTFPRNTQNMPTKIDGYPVSSVTDYPADIVAGTGSTIVIRSNGSRFEEGYEPEEWNMSYTLKPTGGYQGSYNDFSCGITGSCTVTEYAAYTDAEGKTTYKKTKETEKTITNGTVVFSWNGNADVPPEMQTSNYGTTGKTVVKWYDEDGDVKDSYEENDVGVNFTFPTLAQ